MKPVAAVIPIEDLKLLEKLEEEHDAELLEEALADPVRIPFEEIRHRHGL